MIFPFYVLRGVGSRGGVKKDPEKRSENWPCRTARAEEERLPLLFDGLIDSVSLLTYL
jgi:hypothetical protein